MNKKSIVYIIILFLFSTSLIAQGNFKEGYIVTNVGDTVFGLIDFRTDAINATVCKFKPQNNKPEIIYYPGDIAGYRFSQEGKYYVTYDVKIEDKPQKLFLEYLVKGMMNLYYCEISNKKYFFFERDGEMIEVSRNPEVLDMDNMRVVTDNRYRGVVGKYFKDFPSIFNNVGKMTFDQKSFIEMAKQYHDETCTTGEACVIFENEHPDKNSVSFKLSAYGGIQLGTYTITRDRGYFVYKFNGLQPVVGAKVFICNPRWSKSFGAQIDLSLSKFKASKDVKYQEYELNAMIFSGKLGLEYKLPFKKIRPYLGAGFVNTFFFSDDSYLYYNNISGGSKYENKMRNFHVGGFVNLGVDYSFKNNHSIFIQGSADFYSGGDATLENGRDNFKSFNIILGYTF